MLLSITNIISFVLGILIAVVGLNYLRDLAASINVSGTLERQERVGASESSEGPPEGFYVKGPQRFYIDTPEVETAANLGQPIQASGELSLICGPDGLECFPKLVEAKIVKLP